MVKLNRFTMPVFAGNAAQTQTSVFGTMKTSPQYTTDVAASIGTTAYGNGWADAIDLGYAPFMEDMNTLQRAITYQIAYNQQQGIPEWASDTEYYKGSLAKYNTGSGAQIYASLANNNVGNLLSDTTKWKLVVDTANSYVTINTAETITGAKTFTSDVIKSMGVTNSGFKVQTTLNKGTPPTSDNAWGQFAFQDASGLVAGGRLGGVEVEYAKNGSIIAQLEAFEPTANSLNYEKIAVVYPASGSAYTYAPAPALASSASGYANQIVTVGYLNGSSSNVVHKTGNETIAGTKTFSSTISGSINGNAATVTNGVYTTGNQTIGGTKTFSSTIAGSINGNAATVTNGVYTTGNQTIGGTKTFSSSPVVPTVATTDNSTKAASTAFVKSLFTYDWNSTNQSGYIMVADKLIIQRGRVTDSSSSGYWDILFETPFSNKYYSIVAMSGRTDNVSMYALSSIGASSEYRKTTGCRIMANGSARDVGFDWIAVGYK